MSGPKGGGYVVETPAQREARMLRDAKALYARAETLWTEAVSRSAVLMSLTGETVVCQRPAPVASGADSAAYTRAAAELEAAASAAAARVSAAREAAAQKTHASQVARMMQALAAEPTGDHSRRPASRWQASHQAADEPRAVPVVDRGRVKERVDRRLAQLAALDHDAARVAQLIDDIAASGLGSRIDLLLGELDLLITDARAASAHRESVSATRAELAAMRSRVADLAGSPARRLSDQITELIHAETTSLPADLAAAVDSAVRAAEAEDDRLHVVAVMEKALGELGYVVGPQFSTDLAGAHAAFARNASSRYGVKVRLESGSSRFTAQVVKSDSVVTSADEDVAAERAFCTTFDNMIAIAKRAGVVLDVDIRTAPGATGVQVVADDNLARHEAARAGTRKPVEMKRSR